MVSRRSFMIRGLLTLVALVICVAGVPAQAPPPRPQPRPIVLERMFSTPAPWGTPPTTPTWSKDGQRLAFLWNDKGERFLDAWTVDADGSAARRLTDMKRVRPDSPPDDKRTDEEKTIDEKMERGIGRMAWAGDGRRLAFTYAGDLWLLDVADRTATPKRLTHTAAAEDAPSFSPDGKYLAYRSGGDVWLVNLGEPETIQLTRLAKGRDVTVSDFEWAPAGMRMAITVSDQSKVGDSPIPDYLSPDGPSLARPKRVFPGKESAAVKHGVVQASDAALTWIEIDKAKQAGDGNIRRHWSADGARLLYDCAAPDHKHRWLFVADLAGATGSANPASIPSVTAREVFHETDVTNYWGALLLADWLPDGKTIVFVSDRDGDYHLYRVAATGGEPVQLTKGAWQVTAMQVPEKGDGRTVFISSTLAGPSEVQLYKVDALGSGEPVRLTGRAGTHQIAVSPDGRRYATIVGSDVEPQDLFVADAAVGAVARRITASPLPEFGEYAWLAPKYVTFPSRKDGATLHARMLVPPDYKPGLRCPLIMGSVYNNRVRNNWGAANAFDQYLARERGFVVMTVDIRASTPYGRRFRQATMGDLGGIDLEDLISGVEYLDKQGMIDRERVGVWGWSYGGFMTLMAMFKAPEFFRVGVAGAPVSNWLHDTAWVVPLLGMPKDNADAYTRTSPITYAGNLKGRLLIVHSMGDERVLFQDTAALVNTLLMAKKDVDVVWAPKGGHGYDPTDEGQFNRYKRIADYFVQHLGSGPSKAMRPGR
jgi:dipeptidyl-peptidase 4